MLASGLLATGGAAAPAWAASPPVVPCDGAEAVPPPAPIGAPPVVGIWTASDLASWQPPACAGWGGSDMRSLVVISGSFKIDGGGSVMAKFGAVSRFAGIKYWSASGGKFEQLILRAHALTTPENGSQRSDFSGAEMASGRPLAFSQTDNDAGSIVYRMRVREAAADHVVLTSENVDSIRRLLVPLFGPGELQTLYVMREEGKGVWSYYSLARVRSNASGLTDGHEKSIVNRGIALYRHIAGIPTDQNPPAMP